MDAGVAVGSVYVPFTLYTYKGLVPFYVSTLAIISATFLFFMLKGSLDESNSFVRKVKGTVCWQPDISIRSGCIERAEETLHGAIDSSCVCFIFIVSWGIEVGNPLPSAQQRS